MEKAYLIILGIILISFAIGVYFYPQMPGEMAGHWNAQGQVDDYMSKFWGLFLMPIIALGVFLLFIFIPKIDPLKENIKKFRKYFDSFIILITVFLFYIYILTILWNLGWRFNMGRFMIPALAVLIFYGGVVIEKAKRNWFIGIRTPWTLSSDRVWDKTHQLGGKLFKIGGIIILFGVLFPDYVFWFVISVIVLVAVCPIVYSYFEYQKLRKSDQQDL